MIEYIYILVPLHKYIFSNMHCRLMIIQNCEFNGVAGIVGYPVCCIIWRHELKLLLAPSLHFLVIVEIMIKDAHDDYNNADDDNDDDDLNDVKWIARTRTADGDTHRKFPHGSRDQGST